MAGLSSPSPPSAASAAAPAAASVSSSVSPASPSVPAVPTSAASVSSPPVPSAAAASAATSVSSPPVPSADPAASSPSEQNPAPDQKKDRKPRRERLPLPDPIPEIPVKRYAEPSKSHLQATLDAEDAKLQLCFDRLNSTRAFYDQRQKIRDAGRPAFDAARKVFNDLNDHCRALFDHRKDLSNKLKSIKDADIAARTAASSGSNELVGAGKDGNEALKGLRTMEELDERIQDLEYRLATVSCALLEEKKIVAQISFLNHKGRDFIMGRDKSYKDEKAAKEHRIASRKDLEDARNKQDALIDAAKAKLEEQRKVVDQLRAEQDAQIRELQDTTTDIDRDAEKKKIGEIKAVIRKLRDDFKDELDKWYLNERIHYEQQKIIKRKKYEAAQAERDARRKAWEAEQAQYPEPDPYQEQKDMCSGLTVYMQTLLGETVEKPSVVNLAPEKTGAAPTLKTVSNTREITAEGKAIGKSTVANDSGFESLAFSDFVKKSGSKSKNKKGRRSASSAADASADTQDLPLKPHSIDYIAAFTELGIKPPNKISEVRAALEAVKAKKAYYDSKPKPTDEEKTKMAANKSKKQSTPASETKPKSKSVDLIDGDGGAAAFPVLLAENTAPQGSSPAPRDLSGPSFMAVASGAASAPPPPVSTAVMPAIVTGEPVKDGSIVAPPDALTKA